MSRKCRKCTEINVKKNLWFIWELYYTPSVFLAENTHLSCSLKIYTRDSRPSTRQHCRSHPPALPKLTFSSVMSNACTSPSAGSARAADNALEPVYTPTSSTWGSFVHLCYYIPPLGVCGLVLYNQVFMSLVASLTLFLRYRSPDWNWGNFYEYCCHASADLKRN